MKQFATIFPLLLSLLLYGCKDTAAPKDETRVQSASEAARIDDREVAVRLAQQKAAVDAEYESGRARESRLRYVDILRAVSKRWEDGVNEATRTARSDIGVQIAKLQAIIKEASTVDVDDCSSNARNTLQTSMATSLDAFAMFQKETGETGEATMKKMTEAAVQLRAAQAEMEACLNK
jgi:hypothetical protein